MKSMTGFGRGSSEQEGVRVQVEVGSVNRKTLDVQVTLPRGMAALESVCQRNVSKVCRRGRIQVRVQVTMPAVHGACLDRERTARILDELNRFAEEKGLKPVDQVESLLSVPGIWTEDIPMEAEQVIPILESALDASLSEMCAMREQEGRHLQEVLLSELEEVDALLHKAVPLAAEARAALEKRLRSAVQDVAEAGAEVEQRMLQEIALLAEKADVKEELDRLQAHVDQFRAKLTEEGSLGRGLDFLCQELSREWHTLSVKTPHPDLNQLALQGKEGVERLREQVQNVE